MKFGHIALAAAAAAFFVSQAHGAPLPVVKHTFTDKNIDYDISIEYPQTGMKAIDDDLTASVKKYAADFRRESKGAHADTGATYTLEAGYTVVRNDDAVFAVKFDAETDMHGAHPNQDIWTANYYRADGWRIYMPELFDNARALPKISAMVIANLDRTLATGAEPISDKDTIAMGAAPFGPNFAAFALLPNAIHIWFPPYQVASYAAGPQETEIPLAPLKPFLRANPRAPAASFDCAKARTADEAAICSDVALARLDRAVAEAYGTSIAMESDDKAKAAKRDTQRAWLAHRDDACRGAAGPALAGCLTGVYKARLAALQPG